MWRSLKELMFFLSSLCFMLFNHMHLLRMAVASSYHWWSSFLMNGGGSTTNDYMVTRVEVLYIRSMDIIPKGRWSMTNQAMAETLLLRILSLLFLRGNHPISFQIFSNLAMFMSGKGRFLSTLNLLPRILVLPISQNLKWIGTIIIFNQFLMFPKFFPAWTEARFHNALPLIHESLLLIWTTWISCLEGLCFLLIDIFLNVLL